MEHTHLVKGLDFALLAKIKSENKEKVKEDLEKKAKAEEIERQKMETYGY